MVYLAFSHKTRFDLQFSTFRYIFEISHLCSVEPTYWLNQSRFTTNMEQWFAYLVQAKNIKNFRNIVEFNFKQCHNQSNHPNTDPPPAMCPTHIQKISRSCSLFYEAPKKHTDKWIHLKMPILRNVDVE